MLELPDNFFAEKEKEFDKDKKWYQPKTKFSEKDKLLFKMGFVYGQKELFKKIEEMLKK